MKKLWNLFKTDAPNDSDLPTGSPIPTSRSQIKKSPSPIIKHKRRSPQLHRNSPFENRVISERKSPEKSQFDPYNFGIIQFPPPDQTVTTILDDQDQKEIDEIIKEIDEPQKSPQISELVESILSHSEEDSDDIYNLGDYNLTPREKSPLSRKSALGAPQSSIRKSIRSPIFNRTKEQHEIETIGYKAREHSAILSRVVKKAAVSSLASLSSQQQTKMLAANIFGNFFQAFDEWCRQKEKQEKMEAVKRQNMESSAPDYTSHQEYAQQKIKELKEEERRWKLASNEEKGNLKKSVGDNGNVSFTNFSNFTDSSTFDEGPMFNTPLKIDVDYDHELTKQMIVFLDNLQVKIQAGYAKARQLEIDSEDLSIAMGELSKANENPNIDNLLGNS